MNLHQILNELKQLVVEVPHLISTHPTDVLNDKPSPSGWSPKEILGHLADSALHNWQRFAKAQYAPQPFVFEPYDQDQLVVVNRYQQQTAAEILSLWVALNHQILWVISHMPEEKLRYLTVNARSGQQNTLHWLMEDYLTHLKHHLQQIFPNTQIPSMQTTTDLRYPIGKFNRQEAITPERREALIRILEEAPGKYRKALQGLSPEQLETPYRPGGWTVRQVVHHVADSHMNAYIRLKLALTEDQPTIKPYEEDKWAELGDTFSTPVEVSLMLLENLHIRMVNLLRSLSESDWQRTYLHPESGETGLQTVLGLYAWHSQHHLAHIRIVNPEA